MIVEKWCIESYQGFTDEKYIELYDSKEELWQGLDYMSIREQWTDDKEEIFEDLEEDGEWAWGFDYIKIYQADIKL